MKTFYRILARLQGLLRRNHSDAELLREMQAHLELATEENMRRGMSPDAARREAILQSGGIEMARESYRDQRTMPRAEAVLRDLGFAWRGLRRSPGYALPVIVSLALGIGLNTSVFTMMEDVLRRPMPYPHEAELLTVGKLISDSADTEKPLPDWDTYDQDFTAWQKDSRTLVDIAKFSQTRTIIEGERGPEFAVGAGATPNLLRVLGTQVELGRWFREGEQNEPVMVLSHELWQRQFALDSRIVGRTIRNQGMSWTIIGVMPANVGLPLDAQFWVPCNCVGGGQVVARPRPGVALATIAADLAALSPSVGNLRKAGHKAELVVISLHEQLFGSARPLLRLLSAAAALLFLIACANVANLSLARTLERRRELTVRVALGAGRSSLAMLVLSENVLLAVFGALAGLGIAYTASGVLLSLAPAEVSNVREIHVNLAGAAFAFALAFGAAAAVSVAPILNITSARTQPMMGQAIAGAGRGRRLQRVRHTLVVAQLALTLLLMTGAGLLIRSVVALTRPERLGFAPTGVVIANVRLYSTPYRDSTVRANFVKTLIGRIGALPGVQHVAIGPAPLIAGQSSLGDGVSGVFTYRDSLRSSAPVANVWVKNIDVGYLETFGIRLTGGRGFQTTDDAASARVAIINRAAARIFFNDRNPIGQSLPTKRLSGKDQPAPTVVGVVDNVLQRDLTMDANPEVLIPAAQGGAPASVVFAVRTTAPTALAVAGVRAALKEIDPGLAASRLETMQAVLDASLSRHTFLLWLLLIFATLALVLSVIGLYAIVSYLVSQRTVEIGVRMALGAQRHHVFGLVVGESALLVLAGVAAGSASALVFGRMISKFLYEVKPYDTVTLAVGPLVLATVALVATYVPAMRATRVEPSITLRAD